MNCPFCGSKKSGTVYDNSVCEKGHKYYFCKSCEDNLIYYQNRNDGYFKVNEEGKCVFNENYVSTREDDDHYEKHKYSKCESRKCFITQYEHELPF